MNDIIIYLQNELNKSKDKDSRYWCFDDILHVAKSLINKDNNIDKFFNYLLEELNRYDIKSINHYAIKEIYHKSNVLVGLKV